MPNPLCVDCDGSLIKTDLLHESLLLLLKQNPISIFMLPLWLLQGKAYFKQQIAKRVKINFELLPYNSDVIETIKEAKTSKSKDQFFTTEKLDKSKKLLGLFPGSRVSEIEYNYPAMLEAANRLATTRDDLQFITPIASNLPDGFIEEHILSANIKVHTSTENIYDVINACDAIAAASGTVTLQITLMKIPLLIIYKISPTSYRILKKIVNFSYAGIANVIANKEISRELIQDEASIENITTELVALLDNESYVSKMREEMSKIKNMLGEKDGSAATARLAAKLLKI